MRKVVIPDETVRHISIPRYRLLKNICIIYLFEFLSLLCWCGILIVFSMFLMVYTTYFIYRFRMLWKLYYNRYVYLIIVLLPLPALFFAADFFRGLLLFSFNMLRGV